MKTEMNDLITRVLELDEKATPGPWNRRDDGLYPFEVNTAEHSVCSTYTVRNSIEECRNNAGLISFYRTACPQLADRCEKLAKALEVAKAALQEIKGYEAPHREGICPYGCDTPHIATIALTEINKLINP